VSPVTGSFDAARSDAGLNCELDHLVLAASRLDEGVAWCEWVLGVTPGPGGKHPLMGTHNRVFAIGSAAFPRAYFEIIAVDPEAPPPGRRRWFDLDDAALQAKLTLGPQLVHWVARTATLEVALAALARQGIDGGRALPASRATPQGELRWRIAVPGDGVRWFEGALPMLIEWGAVHPADSLPASGVILTAVRLGAREPAALQRALQALRLPPALAAPGAGGPALCATLATPRGVVTLSSC